MISDEVSIYNLALNAVGGRNNIEATTENSREAEVCRLWYAAVRDQILAAARWPSAKAFARLAALAAVPDDGVWVTGSPEPNFINSFVVPPDMLRPQNLTTFGRFSIATSGTGLMLSCNEADPILVYTKRQETIALWDSELQMAVVYGLAAHVCLPLNGKLTRAKAVLEQANALVLSARVGAANTDDNVLDSIPDWLAARSINAPGFQQFIYANGPLLSVPSIG